MPEAAIAFGPQQSDADELGGASPSAHNVCVDKAGTIRRRPGIARFTSAPFGPVAPSGVTLLHETEGGLLYAVDNHPTQKRIYRISGGAALDVTLPTTVTVNGTNRPTVAETEAMLVFAAGEEPTKLTFSTGETLPLGGSPPKASHVIANASRLLLNNTAPGLRGTISHSAPALGATITGHETWVGVGAGSFQAEARPDVVPALHENTNEIFAFGRNTLQYFSPDAQTAYAPVTTQENGTPAPYSIIKADQSFAWLDHQRRFVIGDGRDLKIISGPIQQTLSSMATVSDCYGYRFFSGGVECLVWTFPTDGRTFAFQVGGGWSQWSQYSGSEWQPFPVLSHFQRSGTADNLVGLVDGRVCQLRNGEWGDLNVPITASVTTGFIDRNTTARKKTNCVRVALRRGVSPVTPGSVGFLRYRDDLGAWSDGIPVYVGAPGDSAPVLTFHSVGWTYRMRQWRFDFSASVSYSLVGITEDFTVCSS